MSDWRTERDRALLTLESGKKAAERIEAANLLVELALEDANRSDELAAVLPRLLDDREPRVRREAVALAALTLPADDAEKLLGKYLSDPDPEVRVEAAGQLADMARPSARGLLAAAMQDAEFTVRFEGARGMAALKHSAGIDVLIEALEHDHFRFRALGALAELGDVRALPAIQRIHRRWLLPGFERTQAAGAMARLGDAEGAKWLVERTQKRRGMDRALAVELLGEVRAPGAAQRLMQILADPKDPARGAAARGLGRLGDTSAVPALTAVLEDGAAPDDLRLDAAEGLCMLKQPEARARVEQFASTTASAEVRNELRAMLEEYR